MTRPIHVELPRACDSTELVGFLAGRGLSGSVAATNDHWQIEIRDSVDPDERLRGEVEAALRSWLAQHEPPLVPTSRPDGGYALRPPGD